MTHNDIYTKFMIEYDKANVTSSYPSLTKYEVATVLDKAYNALIAQKITGNNIRRSTFESDVKSIADLEPLVKRSSINLVADENIQNAFQADMPEDMLYFIKAYLKQDAKRNPMDYKRNNRDLPVTLVTHDMATKFFATAYNLPWVKIPVCFLESNIIHIIYDPINIPKTEGASVVYIKQPNTFVKDSIQDIFGSDEFECNNTMAEELISLAVAFALENVESQRLGSKLNMRGLEG